MTNCKCKICGTAFNDPYCYDGWSLCDDCIDNSDDPFIDL